MFNKGSRYLNLPESATLSNRGEWIRAKNRRPIPAQKTLLVAAPQQVTHTILDSDRLDLLAYKYYSDTTRWWQISDINPQAAFPTELLDAGPIVEETFDLAHDGFANRYVDLLDALGGLGILRPVVIDYFIDDASRDFHSEVTLEPSFVELNVVITYPSSPATRQAILSELQNRSFKLLGSFAWDEGGDTHESFMFEDPIAKSAWQGIVSGLIGAPGVMEVQPLLSEAILFLRYNSAMASRESLVGMIQAGGFSAVSIVSSRVGGKILISPNQIV